MKSVVITGVGTCGAYGVGQASVVDALASGTCEPAEVDRGAGFHLEESARNALLVDLTQLSPWLPGLTARRMSPPSRMAVAAARMALEAASLAKEDLVLERTSVCLGVAFGATSYSVKLMDQILDEGPQNVAPFFFMESVANAHAGQVAIALGAAAPNVTITQREASGLLAVIEGWTQLQTGQCDRALVGSADEMAPLAHAVLDRFGALSRSEKTQPYGTERDGFVASEGSTVWVLEEESAARERGAEILGRIVCGVRANDPSASAVGWGRGAAPLANAVRRGLARHDVSLDSIDCVVAGASGSRAGDRLEARLLRELWPSERPSVVAPKAIVGEYGGGFLASCPLPLGPQLELAPLGYALDPELDPGLAHGVTLDRKQRVLCSALAAGGSAAWLLLEGV